MSFLSMVFEEDLENDYLPAVDHCLACGHSWELCNCLCAFCPFDGKCETCSEVAEASKPMEARND